MRLAGSWVPAGSWLLGEGQARIDPAVWWPTAVLVAVAVVIAVLLTWRAATRQPASGPEAFLGREVVLRDASGRSGQTWVDGAWWAVRSDEELSRGQRVRVVGADGLTLIVSPVTSEGNSP